MARNTTAARTMRRIYIRDLRPLAVAARQGAAQAAATARLERARIRRRPGWWRHRWLVVPGAATALGASAGLAMAVAARRSRDAAVAASLPADRDDASPAGPASATREVPATRDFPAAQEADTESVTADIRERLRRAGDGMVEDERPTAVSAAVDDAGRTARDASLERGF